MSDRELLTLAAKAAGIHIEDDRGDFRVVDVDGDEFFITDDIWNPLIDDGDALRLAVKLRLYVNYSFGLDVYVNVNDLEEVVSTSDPYAATRRAIVRAAASLATKDQAP